MLLRQQHTTKASTTRQYPRFFVDGTTKKTRNHNGIPVCSTIDNQIATTTTNHKPTTHRINDGLVAKANEHGEDSEEGKPFLCLLLTVSGVLYAGSLCAIGAMFHYFSGCAANELVMSLTLILAVVSG